MIYCSKWSNLIAGNTTHLGEVIWRNQAVTDMKDSALLAKFHSDGRGIKSVWRKIIKSPWISAALNHHQQSFFLELLAVKKKKPSQVVKMQSQYSDYP